eukprot:TCALIF_12038-PA protein Name:"Protein of unknown function" AED:0.62 eAED:0.62 QI:0/0/0/0.5/1/1/2/0/103
MASPGRIIHSDLSMANRSMVLVEQLYTLDTRREVSVLKPLDEKSLLASVAASKSAGVVGRWGSTSFTSLRTNGESGGGGGLHAPNRAPPAAAAKKFFKSRAGH